MPQNALLIFIFLFAAGALVFAGFAYSKAVQNKLPLDSAGRFQPPSAGMNMNGTVLTAPSPGTLRVLNPAGTADPTYGEQLGILEATSFTVRDYLKRESNGRMQNAGAGNIQFYGIPWFNRGVNASQGIVLGEKNRAALYVTNSTGKTGSSALTFQGYNPDGKSGSAQAIGSPWDI